MITLIRLLLLLLLLIALLKVVRWIADFRNSLNDHFALGEECPACGRHARLAKVDPVCPNCGTELVRDDQDELRIRVN